MIEASIKSPPPRESGKTPMSDEDRTLLAMPSIASQMPVQLKNGACWQEFQGVCNGCHQPLPAHQVTGRVTRLHDSAAAIQAVGVCFSCALLTRYHYRFHDDLRITGPTEAGWTTWRIDRTPFERLRAWLARNLLLLRKEDKP